MNRKLLVAFTAIFLMPALLLAQDGKLRGRVTDKESGEPLIGANVTIDATTLGATTDINGDYVILSVPAGTYTLKASYIGYSPVSISNVRVGSNITITQDFALSSTAITVEAVEIIAQRPLIQRNTTNTVRVATQENIETLPIRGVQNIIALEAGVVQKDGNLYIRGGRAGEVAYFIDGANTTNPYFNSQNINVIQEAIEELQVQTGGFTAEYGGAASGIVRTTTRTGGSDYKVSLDFRTDDFAKPGSQFLGTSAFGFRNAVLTAGGPIPGFKDIRFFVAGQHNYLRNRQAMFLEPFKVENLVDDGLDVYPAGTPLPGPIEFKRNSLYNNWAENNQVQGNLLWNLNQFKFKFSGSIEQAQNPNGGSWTGALTNYYNQKKNTLSKTDRMFGNLRFTHILSPTTFYEVGLSYQQRYARTYDQDFKHNWQAYPDSAANAALGYTGWTSRYAGPGNYSFIFKFPFTHQNAPNNSYAKNKQTSFGATVDFTSQINSNWEFKVGGALESWIMRSYGVGNISALNTYMDKNKDGSWDRTFVGDTATGTYSADYEKRIKMIQTGAINAIGYDYLTGKEVDEGFDGPGKPFMASAYVQSKFEYNDLILNVGARYELFDPNGRTLPTTLNPSTGQQDWDNPDYNEDLLVVNEANLGEMNSYALLLPRVSFSFPVTDNTVFYALYGKFAQMPSLNQLYVNNVTLSNLVIPGPRSPYNLGGATLGFMMRPERLTQYEVGLRQIVTENLAFTLTGFYKDTKDQLQIRRVFNSAGNAIFTSFQNEDFGTQKGLELTLELRRTNRLSARVNYTLSDARGTGSQSRSAQNAVTDEVTARSLQFISPLDYNQAHKGTLMLDYRYARGEGGPVLEGMGLNVLFTFNSGHSYTKIAEPQNLGQATAWRIGVRALEDSRNRNPVEPINASSTPWVFNVDLNWNKVFYLDMFNVELYANVLNLFDTKSVLNVFPTTGTPYDDGWLKSPFAESYKQIPGYEDFYRAINLQNRWAYMRLGAGGGLGGQVGGDLFGAPRQIRLGVKLEY